MTINQFREDEGLVEQWDDMLKNHALLKLVIETLEYAHPDRAAVTGDMNGDISPTRASIELGVSRGYSRVLGIIRHLATPAMTAEGLPEGEYAPEDVVSREASPKPKPKKK